MDLIFQLKQVSPWAVISASKGKSRHEDSANNAALWAELVTLDNGFYKSSIRETRGVYKGQSEDSFLVLGLPLDKAIYLGELFGQESVLTNQGLVFTNGEQKGTIFPLKRIRTFPIDPDNCSITIDEDGIETRWSADIDFEHATQEAIV